MQSGRTLSALQESLPGLWTFALRLTSSTEVAEQLLKDACADMLSGNRAVASHVSPRVDMISAMLTRWRNTQHSASRRTPSGSRSSFASANEACGEMNRRLLEIVYRLPDDERVALILIEVERLSYSEAAWALDISIATLGTRLVCARIAVAGALASNAPPPCAERREQQMVSEDPQT